MNRAGKWIRRALGKEDRDIKEIREEIDAFQSLNKRIKSDEARRFWKLSKELGAQGFLLSLTFDEQSKDFTDVLVTITRTKETKP